MSEIPVSDQHYGAYLQTVVEELETEIFRLQKEKRIRIPIDDPFLEKVCRSLHPLWDQFSAYQKRRSMKELEFWILVINKNL